MEKPINLKFNAGKWVAFNKEGCIVVFHAHSHQYGSKSALRYALIFATGDDRKHPPIHRIENGLYRYKSLHEGLTYTLMQIKNEDKKELMENPVAFYKRHIQPKLGGLI